MKVMLAAGVPLLQNPEFYVALAFLVFVGIRIYYGVPAWLGKALDSRAERIRNELDEARRLREEAQQLLADYKRKAATAENEAREIVERAEIEAKSLAEQAREALKATLERQTQAAEDKIKRSEAQAVTEVRAAAVEEAIKAAEQIIKTRVGSGAGDKLISDAIEDLPKRLN
jgi:F-type H+-transporting ATPase subunit b